LAHKTIEDFGEQWSRFPDNQGWYGSAELLRDILTPLVDVRDISGAAIAEIGSGAGRIVGMLLEAGAGRVYAIEPSPAAFRVLQHNVGETSRPDDVTLINARGDDWRVAEPLDYVVSIGVIHHIPDPAEVMRTAYAALKSRGRMFIWVYGREGHASYLALARTLRRVTTRLPHALLVGTVWMLYGLLVVYRHVGLLVPVPLAAYIETILWRMTPEKRRLVIYDQLKPAYAKYYSQGEAQALFELAGFINIRSHHRHGYSWSVVGEKP
jgi:SAM-dependent methyltransferase